MDTHKAEWLKIQGKEFCTDWVTKMEDEMLEEVELLTPTKYNYSLPFPFLDYEPMVYTIEDFFEFSIKGTLYTSRDSLLFSR